jgi:plasmid stability protein
MAIVQVRNVPDDVVRRLKVEAAEKGQSLNALLLERLTLWAERPTLAEYAARAKPRPAGSSPTTAEIVAEIRKHRDAGQ